MSVGVVLQFTATVTTQCVNVTIVDDEDGEGLEYFMARLAPDGSLPPGVALAPAMASVSILDNEGNRFLFLPQLVGTRRVKRLIAPIIIVCSSISDWV